MKLKLAMLLLTVALSSTAASARDHRHHHYRNSYNAMNVTQGRSLPSGYDRPWTGAEDSRLSGTGPSTFGGSGDSGGAGGGGP
jgi:hypothetical protein